MNEGERSKGRRMMVRWPNKGDGRAIRKEGRKEIEVQKR
jgi:hypothetical protein